MTSGFLLSGEWILNDKRTFGKEGHGEHYLESERGSGLAGCVTDGDYPCRVDVFFRASCRYV